MLRAGDAVGDNSSEQGINAAEHAQHRCINQHLAEVRQIHKGNLQMGEARGNRTDATNRLAFTTQQGERQHGADHKRNQLRWCDFLEFAGREPEDHQGDHSKRDFGRLCVADQSRQCIQRSHHSPLGDGLAKERTQLKNDQDQANPAHEARDHRVRHLGDVTPQAQHPEAHLKEARQHHHGEGHGHAVFWIACREAGDHGGHHHRHRTGGF